jgi:hypothetical protein
MGSIAREPTHTRLQAEAMIAAFHKLNRLRIAGVRGVGSLSSTLRDA